MPETASFGRRIIALLVDWAACSGVAVLAVGPHAVQGAHPEVLLPYVIFVLENAFFTASVGGSFGQMATRLRVVRAADGGRLDLARALLRSLMIVLVIPPLVFRPDGRGLHDMAVGSYVVPLQVPPKGIS